MQTATTTRISAKIKQQQPTAPNSAGYIIAENHKLRRQNAELLEALKECREWYEQYGFSILSKQPGQPTPICFSKALTAINNSK